MVRRSLDYLNVKHIFKSFLCIDTCVPYQSDSFSLFCGNGSEWVNYIAPTPTSTPTAPPPKNPITDNPISSSDLTPDVIIGIVFGCLGFFLLLGGYFL